MDFNIDLNLLETGKLIPTPRLKQSMDILLMNSQDLARYIQKQVETNPILESDEQIETNEYMCDSWQNDTSCSEIEKDKNDDQYEENEEEPLYGRNSDTSLKDYLLVQLHTTLLDEGKSAIGEYLIDNIDENGYLGVKVSEVAIALNKPVREVVKILRHIQGFDPPGVGARNLKECLVLQLKQRSDVSLEVIKIVRRHLGDLASNKIGLIGKMTGLNTARIMEILSFIKTLDPKPGRIFGSGGQIRYIIPDIIISRVNDRYEVSLNEDSLPDVKINNYYRQLAENDTSSEIYQFIQKKIDSALWVMKCIENRSNAVIKVAGYIIDMQQDFLKYGKKYLKPVTLEDAARHLSIHPSIVKRVIAGKYVQCPSGIYELGCFIN